jgi:hypothetical protein
MHYYPLPSVAISERKERMSYFKRESGLNDEYIRGRNKHYPVSKESYRIISGPTGLFCNFDESNCRNLRFIKTSKNCVYKKLMNNDETFYLYYNDSPGRPVTYGSRCICLNENENGFHGVGPHGKTDICKFNKHCEECRELKNRWTKFTIDKDGDLCVVHKKKTNELRRKLTKVRMIESISGPHDLILSKQRWIKSYHLGLKENEYDLDGIRQLMGGIRLEEILTRTDRIVRVLGFLEQVHREPEPDERKQEAEPQSEPEQPIPQSSLHKLTSIPDLNRYILEFLD